MRKKQYVCDALNSAVTPDGATVEVMGWIKSRRRHGRIAFLDIVDSTGTIQVVAHSKSLSACSYSAIASTPVESAVQVTGVIATRGDQREILAETFRVIAIDTLGLQPQPRAGFNIFDPKNGRSHHCQQSSVLARASLHGYPEVQGKGHADRSRVVRAEWILGV